MRKLITLGVRRSLIHWICNFLTERCQVVKLESVVSDWKITHAGVPQGTKLGTILFVIMINDLALKSPLRSNHWKFVDDVTMSEIVDTGQRSLIQCDLDKISSWAKENNMNLNPKKCKEMLLCPLKNISDVMRLMVKETILERVSVYKALGGNY